MPCADNDILGVTVIRIKEPHAELLARLLPTEGAVLRRLKGLVWIEDFFAVYLVGHCFGPSTRILTMVGKASGVSIHSRITSRLRSSHHNPRKSYCRAHLPS